MTYYCLHSDVIYLLDYLSSPGDVDRGMYVLSQGRKKHMTPPGLEPMTHRRPCEYSDH